MDNKGITKVRDSNIELLRLTLMLFIVILHLFGGNQIRENFNSPFLFYSELLIMSFTIMGVNAFVFISGYYAIKFKIKSLVSLLVQILFYSIIITAIFILLGYPIEVINIIKSFLPISSGLWWFMSSYVVLFFIAPYINEAIKVFTKTQNTVIIIGLFFFNSIAAFIFNNEHIGNAGSSVFNFIVIYCLARYIAIYNISFKRPVLIYLVCTILCFAINALVCNVTSSIIFPAFRYANPLIVIAAISFFFIFKNIKPFQSKFINNTAILSLGVYLIHDHPMVKTELQNLVKRITNYSSEETLVLLGISSLVALVFVLTLLIDYVRLQICTPLVNYIIKLISKAIKF